MKSFQRFGVSVNYDEASNAFTFSSGTTGDDSNVAMYSCPTRSRTFGFATDKTSFLTADLKVTPVAVTELAERGISSKPAVVVGNPLSVNIDTSFDVNELSNQFSVTVNTLQRHSVYRWGHTI